MINDLTHIYFRQGVNALADALKEKLDNDTERFNIYPFTVIEETIKEVEEVFEKQEYEKEHKAIKNVIANPHKNNIEYPYICRCDMNGGGGV